MKKFLEGAGASNPLSLPSRQEQMRYSQFSMTSFRVLEYVAKALCAAVKDTENRLEACAKEAQTVAIRAENRVYREALETLDSLALQGEPVVREHRAFKETMYRCLVEAAVTVPQTRAALASEDETLATLRALGRVNQFIREAEQEHQVG